MTMTQRTVYLGFLGCGNIGGGVYHLLERMQGDLAARFGLRFVVKKALVKSIAAARKDIPVEVYTESAEDIFGDPEISVVCEFMGGAEPAATFMAEALRRGKHVVTANKVAFANHWGRLQEAADAGHAGLYYEASVGGVIPIIRTMTEAMEADRVSEVMGIINGTTNYILTRMSREGSSYASVLADAQKLGLAEPNPSADVEGTDAACKIAILASLAFHGRVRVDSVYTEGITKVTVEDIAFGREMGYTLKLLAIAKRTAETVEVRVHPTFVPDGHPLARVDGSLNAVFLRGESGKDIMLQGRGAGEEPTATAVVGNILDAVLSSRPARPTFRVTAENAFAITDNWITGFSIRLRAVDQPGVLSRVSECFAREGVSIATMMQKGAAEDGWVQLVLVTHPTHEQSLRAALAALDNAICVPQSVIRVEE